MASSPLLRLTSSLTLLSLATLSAATPMNFCASDSLSYITDIAAACPPGTSSYRHAGVNLFDIFWDAWSPSSTGSGNMSTSIKAIHDAAAVGVKVARVFAVPWSYEGWGWLNESTRPAYFSAMDTLVEESWKMGVQLIPSLGYGCADSALACNPSLLCPGETYRDLVVNFSSCTRTILRNYAQDVVTRYLSNPAILMWELGNEMNLEFDGCSYDKSDGAFFTSTEGLAFLYEYAVDIRSIDFARPINTGMAAPRLRARHLAATPGGGRNCVNEANPKGDCDLYCPGVDFDTQEDTISVISSYYTPNATNDFGGFDMVSIHWYSCQPPNGNYTWCPQGEQNNATSLPLQVFQSAADALSLPLYVGEYGPYTGIPGGWGPEAWRGLSYISAMAEFSIPLSTLWAFECPSHEDMNGLCLHPGNVNANEDTFATLEVLQSVERTLQGLPPVSLNLTLYMLPPPAQGSSDDPACLDGSPYGYYAKAGNINSTRVVVMLQGGGWCPDIYNCWLRTLPGYSGGALGSSKNWTEWSWGWWFGPDFVDSHYLYLPYADGSSYSGLVYDPVQTSYGPENNTLLYFRGRANLRAGVLDFLQRFGLEGKVEEIVVTGGSAGGLSTTLHTDTLKELMGATIAMGVPQCGFFPFYNETCNDNGNSIWCNATDQFNHTFTMHNASGAMAPACLAQYPGDDSYKCFMAPVATSFVQSPLFIWQSKFDHFQLSAFADLQCTIAQEYNPPWVNNITCSATDTSLIESYGELFMSQIQPYVSTPGPSRAVFLTSCVLHGMDWNYLSVTDTSPMIAFNLWHQAIVDPANAPTMANDYKWIEDLTLPRTDNPLACPPFTFTP